MLNCTSFYQDAQKISPHFKTIQGNAKDRKKLKEYSNYRKINSVEVSIMFISLVAVSSCIIRGLEAVSLLMCITQEFFTNNIA